MHMVNGVYEITLTSLHSGILNLLLLYFITVRMFNYFTNGKMFVLSSPVYSYPARTRHGTNCECVYLRLLGMIYRRLARE